MYGAEGGTAKAVCCTAVLKNAFWGGTATGTGSSPNLAPGHSLLVTASVVTAPPDRLVGFERVRYHPALCVLEAANWPTAP